METNMETKAGTSKTFNKYLHFFFMIFAATIIMWIGMGIIEGFSFGSNTAHWSSIFGGMLGTALIPLSITGIVLIFTRPSTGWITLIILLGLTLLALNNSISNAG